MMHKDNKKMQNDHNQEKNDYREMTAIMKKSLRQKFCRKQITSDSLQFAYRVSRYTVYCIFSRFILK